MPKVFQYQQFADVPPQSLDIPSAVVITEWDLQPVRRFTKRRQRNYDWLTYQENPNTWPSNYDPTPDDWEAVTLRRQRKASRNPMTRQMSFEPKEFTEVIQTGVNIMVPRATIDIVVSRQVIDIVDFEY